LPGAKIKKNIVARIVRYGFALDRGVDIAQGAEAFRIADPLASRTIPVTEPAESWALAELGDTKSVNTNARKENP